MLVSKARDVRFWDRIAEKYSRQPVEDQASYAAKLAKTQEFLAPRMRVLEIGCGTGSTAIHHAPAVAHIDALDISQEMISIARRKAETVGIGNIDFRQGDIDALPPEAGPYDVVMAHSLLHLLRDRAGALGTIHDVLRPGGVFVSSTACLADHMAYAWPVLKLMRLIGKAPYVAMLSEENLVAEIEAAGFTVLDRWRPGRDKAVFLVARKD